jgi:hypothetical protein
MRSENEFEKKIRKALPKLSVSTLDPRNKYDGSKEIGTGLAHKKKRKKKENTYSNKQM